MWSKCFDPAHVHCALIGEFHRDIQGHLKLKNVTDFSLYSSIKDASRRVMQQLVTYI